jgi:hypothetical protein
MYALNLKTGEKIEIDKKRSRVRRCQKRVYAWSKLLDGYIRDKDRYRLVMLTLTYECVEDWKPGHIRAFMCLVKSQLKKNLLGYAWVAELQQRGAVHYHVLLLVRKGTSIPKPDKAGWWVLGMSKIETAKTAYYIAKYTGKEYQKIGNFPKGLRMFAVWVSASLAPGVARWFFRASAWPKWLKDQIIEAALVGYIARRVVGGGWECNGEFYKSPWRVVFS